MQTNEKNLVIQAVTGRIHHPTVTGQRVGFDGKGVLLPGVGGITYNFQIGDNCMELIGDHVEPGISIANRDVKENLALNTFACIGNEATILSGAAKGKKGYVTGIHGGVNHVMVYVDDETLHKVVIDDTLMIKAFGQGLVLKDYENIFFANIDPTLLKKMENIHLELDDKVIFHVAKAIPAHYMGAGIGETTLLYGDYDIMIQSEEAYQNLSDLRFGDIVVILDHDCRNGAYYNPDYITIGVICHSDSYTAGHGPGVTIIACGHKKDLSYKLNEEANIAYYLRKK